MALKSTIKQRPERVQQTFRTQKNSGGFDGSQAYDWWTEAAKAERAKRLVSTAMYLRNGQQARLRQCGVFARLLGGQTVMNFLGSSMGRLDPVAGLAPNRPTFNLIAAICETLVSRLTQSRPAPTFLTDNGDYKKRFLAKKLSRFVQGELYRAKAYAKGAICLLHALVLGDGFVKVIETSDKKVGLENVLATELFVDLEEAAHDEPQRMYQLKLYDRAVLRGMFPSAGHLVETAEKASLDASSAASKSTSDLVMVVEGWSLPSHSEAKDGRHTIACSSGELRDEVYEKSRFPFARMYHHERILGYWKQGVAEARMGTQMEINTMCAVISGAIRLVGVPRVFVEEGSKVNKASLSNKIGVIVPYKGTKPSYEVAPCVPQEIYAERDRLIQYGFQEEGVSFMQATAQKPAGLDSGEAIRSYDDITTDRFAALARRYDNFYVDLAYLMIDKAIDIAKRDGSYSTVYSDKKGTEAVDLPSVKQLKDPFVIQCFNESSLPRDPAGRKQTIAEHVQAGMLSIQEGRRLLNFPDLEQVDTLASASEERIFCYLDRIVEDGKYTPPDPFMNLALAEELVVQYYNLYEPRKLDEERCEMLRQFHQQCLMLKAESMAPPTPGMGAPSPAPTALPEPTPTSPLVPNGAGAASPPPPMAA